MRKRYYFLSVLFSTTLLVAVVSTQLIAEHHPESSEALEAQKYFSEKEKGVDPAQAIAAGNPPGKARDYIKDYLPFPEYKYPSPLFLPRLMVFFANPPSRLHRSGRFL